MKSNINNITQTHNEIPQTYEVEGVRTDNYNLCTERHYQDGWREVVEPTLKENERLGTLLFDAVNDVVTYNIELIPEKSEQEIEAERLATIPHEITPRQFKMALFQLFQIHPEAVETFLKTLPEPDQTIAFISWNGASSFERNNDMVNGFAYVFSLTQLNLDEIFIYGKSLN